MHGLLHRERQARLLVCACDGAGDHAVVLFRWLELTDVRECDRCYRLVWEGPWPAAVG